MSALPLKADVECNRGWLWLVADSEADPMASFETVAAIMGCVLTRPDDRNYGRYWPRLIVPRKIWSGMPKC